ncbi:MAG: phytoene desaturase family protein [Acidimicrobiia bacterium]
MDFDAIVVGGGHNGLVCAAYLAKAGLRTVVIEARDTVGGCASTVDAIGARVNICNCDHVSFRTTPVMEELALEHHGLRYLDVDPAQLSVPWNGAAPWYLFHSIERTLDSLRLTHPEEVDGYQRYLKAALPAVELIWELATRTPTPRHVTERVLDRRGAGVRTLLTWSRRSVGAVLTDFFRSEALLAPAVVTGPSVWGLSPQTPRTGMGALTYAMKHAGRTGRPVGGSGGVPAALASAITSAGGQLKTSTRVDTIVLEGGRTKGIRTSDGEIIEAPVVVVACDPQIAIVEWLKGAPLNARMQKVQTKWANRPHGDGYESKVDAVIGELPSSRLHELAHGDELGAEPWTPTTIVAPSLAELHAAHGLMGHGRIADRPMLYVNIPSAIDETMRPGGTDHLLSLEVLFTPYALKDGWSGSEEPQRWLTLLDQLCGPGTSASVKQWRAMTPPEYELQFSMRRGHAASFPGGPMAALLGKDRELSRYETPIDGLFLTGAATFPGAGVWGASGRNTALVALRHKPRVMGRGFRVPARNPMRASA